MWDKLPDQIKLAIIGFVVTNLGAATLAFQQWLKARFYQGAFANTVQAIHDEKCVDCQKAAKALNEADGIEAKVAPIVEAIKAVVDTKRLVAPVVLPTVEKSDEKK